MLQTHPQTLTILKPPPHHLEDVLTPLDHAVILVSLLPLHQLGLDPVGEAQDCPIDEKGGDLGQCSRKRLLQEAVRKNFCFSPVIPVNFVFLLINSTNNMPKYSFMDPSLDVRIRVWSVLPKGA